MCINQDRIHWHFVILLNVCYLQKKDGSPDEFCGYMSYNPLSHETQVIKHQEAIRTLINIAHLFEKMYKSNEWLPIFSITNSTNKESFERNFIMRN